VPRRRRSRRPPVRGGGRLRRLRRAPGTRGASPCTR
jgi:hypothetical protein